jgi:hypothetical protein
MISPALFDLQARNLLMLKSQLALLSEQVDVALNGLELLRPLVDKDAGKPQEEKQREVKTFGGSRTVPSNGKDAISPDDAAAMAVRREGSHISQGQGTTFSTDKDAVAVSEDVKS